MHDDPSDHDDQGLRERVMVVVMVVTSTTVRQWMQGTGLLTQVEDWEKKLINS